jgi:hypothetical protein
VEWQRIVDGLTPDVTVLREWYLDSEGRMDVPALIIDAYSKFPVNDENVRQEKHEQMKKYGKICDAILVTPGGFSNRPFVAASDGNYRIISANVFRLFLKCWKAELVIEPRPEMDGDHPDFITKPVYERFELELRKNVDKCPICKSSNSPSPVSLIYCSRWDMHFHTDFLDTEEIKYGIERKTHTECDGCDLHGFDYDDCGYSDLTFKYQCNDCGAIYDPATDKPVVNFHPDHLLNLISSTKFYTSKMMGSK